MTDWQTYKITYGKIQNLNYNHQLGPCKSKTSSKKHRLRIKVNTIVFGLTLAQSTRPTVTFDFFTLNIFPLILKVIQVFFHCFAIILNVKSIIIMEHTLKLKKIK